MHLVELIKLVRLLKVRVIIVITIRTLFSKFKKMLFDSKYDEMTNFHKLLDLFINTHKATNIETSDRKNKIFGQTTLW